MPTRSDYKFDAALPHPIKWTVQENQFDDDGKYPKQMSLAVPVASIPALCDYLMSLGDTAEKIKTGKVWDYSNNQEIEVEVVWINGKGKDGQYGDFGTINPQKTESQRQALETSKALASEEIPF
tara:strand:+ start:547 stop:918 length:372 start_codon:yes stop_codon:yes gene_type:complete